MRATPNTQLALVMSPRDSARDSRRIHFRIEPPRLVLTVFVGFQQSTMADSGDATIAAEDIRAAPHHGYAEWLAARTEDGVLRPLEGDSILIVKMEYVDALLNGEKTLEIRCRRLKASPRWIASGGTVYGVALFEEGQEIDTDFEWGKLRDQHKWDVRCKPYTRTCMHAVIDPKRTTPIRYKRRSGQIGMAKFASDLRFAPGKAGRCSRRA